MTGFRLETVGDILDELDGEAAARAGQPAGAARTAKFLDDLQPADYFAEPCPEPALTASGVTTLLTKSPAHLWHAHPGLGGATRSRETAASYRGSLVHRLALGKGDDYRILDFADYRTNAAKEAREACEEDGVIPVLAHKFEEAEKMAARLREQIDRALGGRDYVTELVIAGRWGGIWRRCMVDVWCSELAIALDVKTTADISDARMIRAFAGGYARQKAWYLDLIDAATGEPGRNRFQFLFVEGEAPYLGRTADMTEAWLTGARSENWRAERLFRRCLDTGDWPGPGHFIATPPAWATAQWIEQEMEDQDQ